MGSAHKFGASVSFFSYMPRFFAGGGGLKVLGGCRRYIGRKKRYSIYPKKQINI